MDRVAHAQRRDRHREYALLVVVLGLTSIPYVVAAVYFPAGTALFVAFILVFKVIAAFVSSGQTGVSHHVRFLLSGSNPFGMAATGSMLFGGVDSILDWSEDEKLRQKRGVHFWVTTWIKFVMTPLAMLFLAAEFSWDIVLLRRRWSIVKHKWNELFSLAYFHDLICPEKSNDLFYADLAFARHEANPLMYQWNRMRVLVFEVQDGKFGLQSDTGSVENNLFRVGDLASYQILKRLHVEELEEAIERHFAARPFDFPVPEKIAGRLVANARPVDHYLKFRRQLGHQALSVWGSTADRRWRYFVATRLQHGGDLVWHLLRMLDEAPASFSDSLSRYITEELLQELVTHAVLERTNDMKHVNGYCFTPTFLAAFQTFLATEFDELTENEAESALMDRVPSVLSYRGKLFAAKET